MSAALLAINNCFLPLQSLVLTTEQQISLGMALIGAITWVRCALLIIAQSAATMTASYIVYSLFNGGLNVGTGLGGGTSIAQGIVIEMILTAQLAFTIFMLAAEQHEATYLAPIGIGLSLFIGELVGISSHIRKGSGF